MYYSQDQIDRAKRTNLEVFLRGQGEELVRSGREYRWKKHDSLTIRENKWFRHSNSTGGYPIDFVMEFYGKSFQEAVEMLIGEPGEGQIESVPAPAPEFHLPLRNVTSVNALKYLTEERGLSEVVVKAFMDAGDIYEDARHHNVVFIGRDGDGVPRFAHCRGTSEKFRQDVAGSDKSYGFSHQGKGDQLYVFEAPIDLLSCIDLFPKNWQERNYLSLGGVGGKALERFLSEHKNINRVYLCLDSDQAGNDACVRLAKMIPDGLEIMRLKPLRKDWNELLLHKDEDEPDQRYEVFVFGNSDENLEPVTMIRMSDVIQTKVDWLWKPYIPFGKLTMVQGNPGEGKTYFAMQLCAACTNREELPGMEVQEPFNVIYQTAEDGLGDTVKPRLIESGADLNRVLVIDDSKGDQLTLSDSRIERAIRQNGAKLVIIDPIQAFLGANVDMNRANEVRPIFRQLGDVAHRTGCAIVLIGHLNKNAGMQSTYRGLGSIDFTASVRSLLFIGKVKDDPNLRVLTHEKSSLAPPGDSIAFILGDDEGFRWIGKYDITADEMLSGGDKKKDSKTKEAKDMICTMLAGGKKVLSEEIDRAAIEKGISTRTVRDAKRELGKALKSKIVEGRKKLYWME